MKSITVSYQVLKTLIRPTLPVLWKKDARGQYSLWLTNVEFFVTSFTITQDEIDDFEANYKKDANAVSTADDAEAIGWNALGLVSAPTGTTVCGGSVVVASTAETLIRDAAYTPPADAAKRSLCSTSDDDTDGGSGAHGVRIVYFYVSSGVMYGPCADVVTLNGTTPVATNATNIQYIERIDVLHAGAGDKAAGDIKLFTGEDGTGDVISTILTGQRSTRYAHHYVASNRTCLVHEMSYCTTDPSNALFVLRARDVFNQIPERRLVVRSRADGSTFQLQYHEPLKIVGPVCVTASVIASNTNPQQVFGGASVTDC